MKEPFDIVEQSLVSLLGGAAGGYFVWILCQWGVLPGVTPLQCILSSVTTFCLLLGAKLLQHESANKKDD